MTTMHEDKGNRLRIFVSKKDYEKLAGCDVTQTVLKRWIQAGRAAEEAPVAIKPAIDNMDSRLGDMDRRLARIEEKLDTVLSELSSLRSDHQNHVALSAQVGHLLSVLSYDTHQNLESIRAKAKSGLTHQEAEKFDFAAAKSALFRELCGKLFPGLVTDIFLNFRQEK